MDRSAYSVLIVVKAGIDRVFMDYDLIVTLHKTDPAFLALRKDWLPLAISCLYHIFKRKHEIQIARDVFREQLDMYIENINGTLPKDAQYNHDADYYIDRWSREDDLIRVRAHDNGYVILLSPHAERLIGWFEDIQNRGMIGTESRLRTILTLLDEVVTRSTDDVETRLRQLYTRRDELEAEIARIQETGQVEGFTDVQIRERLEHISSMASQLLRDFSRIEERFRELARSIQQAQLNPDMRRGEILRTALDADEQIETSDEGQSFRTFYDLLTQPAQREKFDLLVDAVFGTPRLSTLVGENIILRRLASHLLDSGERVNQSNQRLAEHLRRVVDTRNLTESRRVQGLSREIKHVISQLGDTLVPLISNRAFYTIEGEPDVELPLARPIFTFAQQVIANDRPQSASMLVDDEALATLYNAFFIDQTFLHDNIERQLMSRSEVTLTELVTSYPVKQGMVEIVVYLLIAASEPHTIDRTRQDAILITMLDGNEQQIIVPRVLFRRVAN
jgi:hypothetical protein